ncbi:MAG TPA: class I SAM-dependent methyltransferase [Trueperaceae bacterium]|nr:class I SAM-dependent methyltransferase [Trueperaceae bacterium]
MKRGSRSSWDAVAGWYDATVGVRGSPHHRKAAIPTVMRLADLRRGERVIDVGCGTGVLAFHVVKAGAEYLGVDASAQMIRLARRRRGEDGRFEEGDARDLAGTTSAAPGTFDAAVFLLSLQDMDPLDQVFASTARVLKPDGRVVAFMVHPAFRPPRGSGWGYDPKRKLTYRRVERYLTAGAVPMKEYAEVRKGAPRGATISFHRPLQDYVNALAAEGLWVDALVELPDPVKDEEGRSNPEIPLFLALRARRVAGRDRGAGVP